MKLKRSLLAVAAFAMLLVLSACVPNSEVMPSPAELREALAPMFSEELEPVEEKTGRYLYYIDEALCQECYFWFSSGGTAEELTLIRCRDEEAAEKVLGAAVKRNGRQTETYKAYAPAEVAKLEKSFIRKNGEWVVLCVSNQPEGAEELLAGYFPK